MSQEIRILAYRKKFYNNIAQSVNETRQTKE